MTHNQPEKGDKVSWNWGGGAPGGTVVEKKTEGQVAIKSKRGNTIKKNAEPDNPAVQISRSGNDVVKKASELNVEEKNSETKGNKKRKARTEESEESSEEEESDPHTLNQDGKEVKKGGKKGNKKQKGEQEEGSQIETNSGEEDEEEEEEKMTDEDHESETSDGEEDDGKQEKKKQKPSHNAKGSSDKADELPGSNNTANRGSPKRKDSVKERKGSTPPREKHDGVSSRTRSQGKK
ncbi:hypothetical protein F5X96DRAFT_670171 [Biscogniauxia mediterranea]|nr:hypothetical protein F5X96DRAFT_670171 [Biscogniauxia mediterranea]